MFSAIEHVARLGTPPHDRSPSTPETLVRRWLLPLLPSRIRGPTILAIDAVVVAAAYHAAFGLRFDFDVPDAYLRQLGATLPVLVLLRLVCLWRLGVVRGSWRHVGLTDLAALATAVTASSLLFVGALFMMGRLDGMPRAVLVLDWLLFIFLAGGVRFATRYTIEGRLPTRRGAGRRTLVIGAGEAAERFLRTTLHDGRGQMAFIGLLDDGPTLRGVSLHGVRVLGPTADLRLHAARHRAELIVIALPSATGEQMRRIVGLCTATGLEFKILPSLRELIDGGRRVGQLRDVGIEDLLGRAPIHLDLERVERDLARRTVLVTGGAGSIGSELARQIAGFCPARLVLFEQAESPLYFVHLELARTYPGLDVVPVVGDVTDRERLDAVFAAYRPDYVFHAAAYKHVPMMEGNVGEAVRNNVVGTLRVAECAARHRTRKFVLISTDKAVNPSSVMGATKRLAELTVLGCPALRESGTDFRAVRFGNVLGSDGSVIPLFRRQLADGGPLTVTHPDVRRYFMSIPEAVQLVLQASALPEAAGRISMLEMGEPVRIVDLAEQLIRLSGLIPYRDVHIVFTGLRPGEKLDEELTSLYERSSRTEVEKIRVVRTDGVGGRALDAGLRRLCDALARDDRSELVREMRSLVPEYVPRTGDVEMPLPSSSELGPGRSPAGDLVPREIFELGGVMGPLVVHRVAPASHT